METAAAAARWAATWAAAWPAHDVEAVVALYADGCVHRSTPFRPAQRGREGVRAYLIRAFADERSVSAVRFGTPVVEGDRAWVEYWVTFSDERGEPATLAGCALAIFNPDGQVTEARDYWHLAPGHIQPPPDWG